MGINTDLNIDPYFDDFDETKQFNRILFKPARAVQARELTQLQTILQNQVERVGSNIYKEGTIISGINIVEQLDVFYVKLNDQSDFDDPTIYAPSDNESYFLVGETSELRAQIVDASNGFQTRDPDLKTFFIRYLGTGSSGTKQFIAGEVLSLRNSNDEQVIAITAANVNNHAGRSSGISVSQGIIYQKGHFIYVEPQSIIISKYTNNPDNVSVGFEIEENIVNSNQDQTLLDNAQGFNNENAPGADRLQLKPVLRSYSSDSEPDEFFAIIRYSRGEAVTIRDVTEFNSIATEMARRTFEESGNYVVRGMNVSIEQEIEDGNTVTYASVSPGKAYVEGYEVRAIAKRYLPIEPATSTLIKPNQGIGASYSGYYSFDATSGEILNAFSTTGERYSLKNSGGSIIGSCSVANVESGKIYVYAITKNAGQENTAVAKIADTPVTSQLFGASKAARIFASGKLGIKELSGVAFVRRYREAVSPGTNQITIESSANVTPLRSNIVVIDASNQIMGVSDVIQSGDNVVAVVDDTNAAFVYYDAIVNNVESDTLSSAEVFVKTNVTNKTASLGIPNVVSVIEIIDNNGNGNDVTNKFSLVNNQKEGFYDISYLQLRTGETLTNTNLLVKMKALRRSSNYGNGYLDAKSYQLVDRGLLRTYSSKDGRIFDLPSSIDFRPYANPFVSYSFSSSSAPTVSVQTKSIISSLSIANNSTIFSDQEFYLSRIDSVVVDSTGVFSVVKGVPSEIPSFPSADNVFPISNIFVSGGSAIVTTGPNAISLKTVSTKNYTMKDIESIEKRVNILTDAVTLSLLEANTNSLFIDDGAGNNRFKNGILVDAFKDLNVADVVDGEYRAAIDTNSKVLSPAVKQFPIDLRIKDGSNVNTGFKDIVSLSDTGNQTTTISQRYATDFRNAVSNFYNFRGMVAINPQFDSGYDVVQNPASNIDIDIATPLLDLIDNIQEFYPLTRSNTSSTTSINSTQVSGGRTVTTETLSTTVIDSLESSISSGPSGVVGNFVTDFSLKPYARRREVQILVTGLRPNAIHHFFFDEILVDGDVFPANANPTVGSNNQLIYDVRNVVRSGTNSSVDIRTDSSGILAAIFVIPENTFFTGELTLEISDVDSYSSIKSAGTSYGRVVYRAYDFGVNKTEVTYSTRSVDFDTSSDILTTRSVSSRFEGSDPLAQTFYVKTGMTQGASAIFVHSLDLFFKGRSESDITMADITNNGVTIQLREVINGYPSSEILPFGSKHLSPGEVLVSEDSSISTTVIFDNPIRLNTEKEYSFVVMPDAVDPNYLVYTSKVGGNDKISGVSVTNDWGDGVLFTSTNGRAWKSYQDEDVKFNVKTYNFSDQAGHVNLVPNNPEFFTITGSVKQFLNDEIVYSKKSQPGSTYSVSVSGFNVTVSAPSVPFSIGDYVVLTQETNVFASRIVEINSTTSQTIITTKEPSSLNPNFTGTTVAELAVGGRVEFFNRRRADRVHLTQSSARTLCRFEAGDTIIGLTSGATAVIDTIEDVELSYFQPMILADNTVRTLTSLDLFEGSTLDKSIPINDNVFMTTNARTVPSKSRIVDNTLLEDVNENFIIRINMGNNGFSKVSPALDAQLSMLNAYKYDITDDDESSSYVSKQIGLQEDLDASGLRVLLSAYRPVGTYVDVYARFIYSTNADDQSDWIELDNANPILYSNISNVKDYREFEYNLADETNEFSSFQIKIVMRHATSQELSDDNLSANISASLFPHVYDYRAVALT